MGVNLLRFLPDTSFSVEWLWYGLQYCFEAETVSYHPSNSVHIVYSGFGTASHLNKFFVGADEIPDIQNGRPRFLQV